VGKTNFPILLDKTHSLFLFRGHEYPFQLPRPREIAAIEKHRLHRLQIKMLKINLNLWKSEIKVSCGGSILKVIVQYDHENLHGFQVKMHNSRKLTD
jgi:hypothetical protein